MPLSDENPTTIPAAAPQDVEVPEDIIKKDLTTELWREYDFGGRNYPISNPQWLFMRKGGTTHRVLDDQGVVHCVPAPGYQGCALRWKNKDPKKPCEF